LFFVATGRGDGRHIFNREYAAHSKAVEDMLRNQRQAPRSAAQ
jgi:cell division protein YceG involved in septum cleavage